MLSDGCMNFVLNVCVSAESSFVLFVRSSDYWIKLEEVKPLDLKKEYWICTYDLSLTA